eukprot:scaffold13842_cov115-Isochrysis_galbana.AAC.10
MGRVVLPGPAFRMRRPARRRPSAEPPEPDRGVVAPRRQHRLVRRVAQRQPRQALDTPRVPHQRVPWRGAELRRARGGQPLPTAASEAPLTLARPRLPGTRRHVPAARVRRALRGPRPIHPLPVVCKIGSAGRRRSDLVRRAPQRPPAGRLNLLLGRLLQQRQQPALRKRRVQ